MADLFDTSALGQAEAPTVSVKEGIETPQATGLYKGISTLVDVGSYFLDEKIQADKAAKEKKDYSPQGKYALVVSKYTDAVASGEMSRDEANARMRVERDALITAHPEVNPVDFYNIQQEAAGVDSILKTGTEEEIQEEAIQKRARDQNYILPGMAPDVQQAQINAMLEQDILTRERDAKMKLWDYQSKRLALSDAERARRNAEREEESRDMVRRSMKIQNGVVERHATTIVARTKLDVNDPNYLSGENAQRALDELKYQLESIGSEVGAYAGADFVGLQTKPMLNYLEGLKDVAIGKTTRESLDNRLHNETRTTQLALTNEDPTLRTLSAAAQLFPNVSPELAAEVSQKFLALYMKMGNAVGNGGKNLPELLNAEDAVGMRKMFRMTGENVEQYVSGQLNKQQEKELHNMHASILKTIAANPSSDAKSLTPMVDYLASPTFREYMKKSGGVPAEKAQVVEVLDRQYRDTLVPLIKDKLTTEVVSLPSTGSFDLGKTAPLSDYVKASYRGGSVVFEKVGPIKDAFTNRQVEKKISELNDQVARPMTRMVNMSANLNLTNPDREWEVLQAMALPAPMTPAEDKKKGKIDRTPQEGLTQEEVAAQPPKAPELDPEDAKWIKDAPTLAEKKRRAERLGIPLDMIEQATRGL